MTRTGATLFVQVLVLTAVPALAHIGSTLYPVYHLSPTTLGSLDLHDGSVADWEALVGPPSVTTTDFLPLNVGDGASMGAPDLTTRIWLGWSQAEQRVYVAAERVDDVYVNVYEGGNPLDIWRYDSIEFMIDGDHTGGVYNGFSSGDYTQDEIKLLTDFQAQQYLAIPESPDGITMGYLGSGSSWVPFPPYGDAGGGDDGGSPNTAAMEFYVTPFDELNWQGPELSVRSTLEAGRIIGFQISLPDFDAGCYSCDPGGYHGFSTLAGQPNTWRLAENFVDGELLAPTQAPQSIISVTSSVPKESDDLGFGFVTGATDGIDLALGELERPPLPPAGVFDVRFVVGGTNGSLVDLRDPQAASPTWEIRVQPGSGGLPITLTWDPARLPAGMWRMTDVAGAGSIDVNMNDQSSVTISDAAITGVIISPGGGQGECVYDLPQGWSMISLCGTPTSGDTSLATNFPEAISLFGFEGGYQQALALSVGEGYWINMGSAQQDTVSVSPATSVTLDLPASWSMIGGPYGSVSVAALQSAHPSVTSVFGFNGGYQQASTIESAAGYWINKASGDQLTLTPSAARRTPTSTSPAGTVLWAESGQRRQTLSLGVSPGEVVELPPRPMAGAFDFRALLHGERGSWQVPAGDDAEYRLVLQGSAVTIGWDVADGEAGRWELVLGERTILLSGSGAIDLGDAGTLTQARLRDRGRQPEDFGLSANCPNPFNPNTSIRYHLRDRVRVTLRVYDSAGRLVRDLAASEESPGEHVVEWDGRDASGNVVSSGLYLYELRAGGFHAVRKMMLMK